MDDAPRDLVRGAGPLDTELLHAAAQGIGMETEDLGSPARSFNDPADALEHFYNVALFDVFEGRGAGLRGWRRGKPVYSLRESRH